MDATISMLLCQGVVEPHRSGLGGGFLMLIYRKSSDKVVTLDARGVAPILATDSMLEDHLSDQSHRKHDHYNSRRGNKYTIYFRLCKTFRFEALILRCL